MRRLSRVLVGLVIVAGLALVIWRRGAPPPYQVVGRIGGAGGPRIELPVRKVKVGISSRSAIQVQSGAPLEVALDQPGALLFFSIASRTANGKQVARARFLMEAEEGGTWRPVFDETPKPDELEWNDQLVNLANVAPNARRLRFLATEVGATPEEGPAELYWSSVVILQRPKKSIGSAIFHPAIGRQPNVIFISLDTLSAPHLSAFGAARGVSPSIDALLAKSFSFTRAYAQYPNTLTSHASMFSGLLPRHHGVYAAKPYLRAETLTSVLATHGYVANAITEDAYVAAGFGFDNGFDFYDDGESKTLTEIVGNATRTFARARSWLDVFGPSMRFFMFVHTYEAHSPYEIRDYEARRTVERLDPGYRGRFENGYRAGLVEMAHNNGKYLLGPQDLKHLAALYAGGLQYLDRLLADFMRHLATLPFAENTVVIITSDHGEEFGEHGKLGHGETIYEGAIHVPLAFYWPGVIEPGVSDVPVRVMDIMPTILDIVGLDSPSGLDGRSLLPLITGENERGPAPPVYSEVRYAPFAEQKMQEGRCLPAGLTETCEVNLRTVRTERFKLIASKQTGFEAFFDLDHDPGERVDVRTKFPEELARHRALLDAYDADSAPRETQDAPGPEPTLDSETEKRLRALGYVH